MRNLGIYLFISTLIFSVSSCKKDSNSPSGNLPVADFTFSPANGYKPLKVSFQNKSTNASNYEWDFGNGEVSNLQNPTTTYVNDGVYTITLKVTNEDGTDKITKTVTVKNPPTSVLITKVEIVDFPETKDGGDNWDSSLSGSYPDVYFEITDKDGTSVYTHDKVDRKENLRKVDLPVSWEKTDGFYEYKNLNDKIGIRLFDYESFIDDEYMGGLISGSTFSERIEDGNLEDNIVLSLGDYSFKIGIKWNL